MTPQPVFLDVNVPMYAAGADHPYREPCAWVLAHVAKGMLQVAIDSEILQEILYRYGELQRWDVAVTLARSLLQLVPTVYSVGPGEAELAIELHERYAPQGVKARDLIHVAVMQRNGLTQIISTDHHFDQVAGIERLDPSALWAERRLEGYGQVPSN